MFATLKANNWLHEFSSLMIKVFLLIGRLTLTIIRKAQ